MTERRFLVQRVSDQSYSSRLRSMKQQEAYNARGQLIRIEDLQEFSLAKNVNPAEIAATVLSTVRSLDEVEELEPYLRKIILDFNQTPHGPAEIADIFTHHVTLGGKPRLAAFVIKGRSFKTVRPVDVSGILLFQYERLQRTLGRRPTRIELDRNCRLHSEFYRLASGSWAKFQRIVDEYYAT